MNKMILEELLYQYKVHSDARDAIGEILDSGMVNFEQHLPQSQKCVWIHCPEQYGQCDYWETTCGHTFTLIDGTPADNEMKFCPYCGKRLVVDE